MRYRNINFNWQVLHGLLFVCGAIGTVGGSNVYAAQYEPTATITIGAAVSKDLAPTSESDGVAEEISVPLAVDFTNTKNYQIGASLDCSKVDAAVRTACSDNSALIGKTTKTALNGVSTGSTLAQLKGKNAWGFSTTQGTGRIYTKMPTTIAATGNSTNVAGANTTTGITTSTGAGKYTTNLHFAAGVNGAQVSDNYVGSILVTVIANPIDVIDWSINYNANGGSGAPAMESGTELGKTSITRTLSSTKPTRSGWTFLGWSENQNATTASYPAGGNITLTNTSNETANRTLYAVWQRNTFSYSITYNANNGSGAPATQTGTANEGETGKLTISSTKPTRTGYTFLGWATSSTATEANGNYDPGDIVSFTSAGTISLHAVWKSNTPTTMQEMTVTYCDSMTDGQTVNLVDDRGPKYSYMVGKLKDGKCWMLQNLALPGGTTITSADSDVSSNYTLPSSNQSSWSSSTAYMWNGTHTNNADDTAMTSTYNNKNETNLTAAGINNTGAYYNFLAATAGTGTSGTQYSKAVSSICPKGWRLPTNFEPGNANADSGDFTILYKAYGSSRTDFQNALHRAATGDCSSGKCPNQDNYVYSRHWSSSIANSTNGYSLTLNTSGITLANYYLKSYGGSVRCVFGS